MTKTKNKKEFTPLWIFGLIVVFIVGFNYGWAIGIVVGFVLGALLKIVENTNEKNK